MSKGILALSLLLLTVLSHATTLQPLTLTDQWDKPQLLDSNVSLLVFSNHKKGSAWVKTALQELKAADLGAQHWLYVSNISSMPGLITKMFALPKMRKYAFPVALIRDDSLVENWPKKKGFVAVYSLSDLEITAVEHFDSAATIKRYLQDKM